MMLAKFVIHCKPKYCKCEVHVCASFYTSADSSLIVKLILTEESSGALHVTASALRPNRPVRSPINLLCYVVSFHGSKQRTKPA